MGKKRKGHKSHHSRKNPQGFGIELSDFGSKLKSAINAKKHEQEETEIKDNTDIGSHFEEGEKPKVNAQDIEEIFLSNEDYNSIDNGEHLKPSEQKRTVYISGQYWHQLPHKPQKTNVSPKSDDSHRIVSKKSTPIKKKISKDVEQQPKDKWREIKTKPSITINPKSKKIIPEQKNLSDDSMPEAIHWQINQVDHKEERDIVIGFDFGTSCSKIRFFSRLVVGKSLYDLQ